MPIIQINDKKVSVDENQSIKDACENLGVPFGCTQGICGTCMIEIEQGEENLSNLTKQEIDLQRDRRHRLACQTKIKSGTVIIKEVI